MINFITGVCQLYTFVNTFDFIQYYYHRPTNISISLIFFLNNNRHFFINIYFTFLFFLEYKPDFESLQTNI